MQYLFQNQPLTESYKIQDFLTSLQDRVTIKRILKSKRNSKKNLQTLVSQNQDYEVFFLDESRFGTHSRIGHGWFKTGLRPEVKKKLGYQNFYLYGAGSPKTGDSFSLIMPNVDVNWMNKFLEEFSLNLESKKAILVMDQDGWHKSSSLIIPQNIKIIHLSPYSPELNPAEKLWQFIKDNILKNVIYDTLTALEEKLCAFINNINSKQILSICNVNYMPYYL